MVAELKQDVDLAFTTNESESTEPSKPEIADVDADPSFFKRLDLEHTDEFVPERIRKAMQPRCRIQRFDPNEARRAADRGRGGGQGQGRRQRATNSLPMKRGWHFVEYKETPTRPAPNYPAPPQLNYPVPPPRQPVHRVHAQRGPFLGAVLPTAPPKGNWFRYPDHEKAAPPNPVYSSSSRRRPPARDLLRR